jgi:hypothetical protein
MSFNFSPDQNHLLDDSGEIDPLYSGGWYKGVYIVSYEYPHSGHWEIRGVHGIKFYNLNDVKEYIDKEACSE